MGVLEQRCHVAVGGLVVVEALRALVRAPAEADAAPGAGRRGGEIDLLQCALADVADPQVTRGGVEREAPRVAQAARPDLGPGVVHADQRVVGGDGVAEITRRCHRVDPQQLAEQRRGVERQPIGVAAGAPVTQSVVEVAVRAERDVPAVVVPERLLDRDHRAPGLDVGDTVRIDEVLLDHAVAVVVGRADVEARAVGREGQAEEPALAVGRRAVGDVEHDVAALVTHGVHHSPALTDVERIVTAPGSEHDRAVEVGDRRQRDGHVGQRGQWCGRRRADGRGAGGDGRLAAAAVVAVVAVVGGVAVATGTDEVAGPASMTSVPVVSHRRRRHRRRRRTSTRRAPERARPRRQNVS